MSKTKLICFDVDGTLVDGTSWLLLTEGLGCSLQEHLDIFHRAKRGEISFVKGEKLLTKMYQDSGNATKSFIRELFSKIEPRKEARSLFGHLKKKGFIIYLISGAIDIFVGEIANKLEVDGFYANSRLDFNNSGLLTKIHYRDNQGEVKVEQLKKLNNKLGINMNQVVFVGDSENDIEVFKVTGKGIAVHCFNEDLKKVAWKSANSLSGIKNLLQSG